jgi:hypothetical protein
MKIGGNEEMRLLRREREVEKREVDKLIKVMS